MTEPSRQIRVIYSFARSGGTLLNRILGRHPDCVILSEVAPFGGVKSLPDQACDWFNLITEQERGKFANLPYVDQIRLLDRRATSLGKFLVIRDWTTVSFLNTEFPRSRPPSRVLEQQIYLQHAGFEIIPVVFTRRAQEVFRSIRSSFEHLAGLGPGAFLRGYLAFCRRVAGMPVFHLEELRRQPSETVQAVLQALRLPPVDPTALVETFDRYVKCTGNNTLRASRPSAGATRIWHGEEPDAVPAPAPGHPGAFAAADQLLGYAVQ